MRAIAAGITDVGRERDHNEDRFVLLPEFGVYVVADGMGGHQCGEVASRMATSTIATFFREHLADSGGGDISEVLRDSLFTANERIHRRATSSNEHRGMGTTIVAAAYSGEAGRLYVAHAGDSRCYRLRDGAFDRITRDHSLVEEALRNRPDMTETELASLPGNVITRALGVESTIDIDVAIEPVAAGDVYLLCSDGLHGFVEDERIHQIVAGTEVLTEACGALVEEANNNGGGDNITAVLIRIERRDQPWDTATSVPAPPARANAGEDGAAAGGEDVDAFDDTARWQIVVHSTSTDGAAGVTVSRVDGDEGSVSISSSGDASPAPIDADDTARLEALGDPDEVLAGLDERTIDDDPDD